MKRKEKGVDFFSNCILLDLVSKGKRELSRNAKPGPDL